MDCDIADCLPPLVTTLGAAEDFAIFFYAKADVRRIYAVENGIYDLLCATRPVDVQGSTLPNVAVDRMTGYRSLMWS